MGVTEFDTQFDLLYNNVTSNAAPGLDAYEKSVFLTQAQDQIVKAYFNNKLNKVQQGFDESQRRQIDFSMIIRTKDFGAGSSINDTLGIFNNSRYYSMPDNVMFYINEVLQVTRKNKTMNLSVIPLNYEEYQRQLSKPFKRPLKNQAWRIEVNGLQLTYTYTDYKKISELYTTWAKDILEKQYNTTVNVDSANVYTLIANQKLSVVDNKLFINNIDYLNYTYDSVYNTVIFSLEETTAQQLTSQVAEDIEQYIDIMDTPASTTVELIPSYGDSIQHYIVKYVKKPTPIILADLSEEGVTIDGMTDISECVLDPIIHQDILERAVELAKASYSGTAQDMINYNQYSRTEKGQLTNNR